MALIIKADGTTEELSDTSLNALQKAVGGYIEAVRLPSRQLMYVDEEGLLKRRPQNLAATILAMQRIVGDAVVLTEEETRKDEQG